MSTSSFSLVEHTEFGKIKDVFYGSVHDRNGLMEFVKNVVMNMNMTHAHNNNGYGIMLPDLSDIYVLVSKVGFPFETLSSVHTTTVDLTAAKKSFVLGYIWLSPLKKEVVGHTPCHFINFIDSRISGLNIAKYMVEAYETDSDERFLFPYEVDYGAKHYWAQYFTDVYCIKDKLDLVQMLDDCGMSLVDVKWDQLFTTF